MLLLVDISNIYWRNNSKLSHLRTRDGDSSGGLWGTMRTLEALERRFAPDELCIVEDGGSQLRKKIYPGYKGDRMPKEMWQPHHHATLMTWALAKGFSWAYASGFEADDVIAHFCQCEGEVVIVSSDHDFKQLLEEGRVFILAGNSSDPVYTASDLVRDLGIAPEEYLPLLSITGDSSDNVSGVRGMGAKTVARLFNEFGGFEQALGSHKLRGHMNLIARNMEVLSFKNPSIALRKLRDEYSPDAERREKLIEIYEGWEMNSLLKSLLEAKS